MNPFGITEVDIPGVYGAVMGARTGRLQQLLLNRQIEAAETEADRSQGVREAYARFAGRGTDGNGSRPRDTASPFYISPENPSRRPPAPRAPAGGDRGALIADLMVLDPQQAAQVQQMFGRMDDAQHQQSQRANLAIGREAQYMLTLPESQWPGELQQAAERLIADGVSRETIEPYLTGRTPLTRQALESLVANVRDIEKIREETRPQLRNVGAGDVVIDERTGRQVFESPYMRGPSGETYRREEVSRDLPLVRSPDEARRLPPGTRFRLPDGRVGTVPGGPQASNPAGTFPVSDGGRVVREIFPNARITGGRRAADSRLGRANPRSWHIRSGGAVDIAPIPGITFDQYVQRIRAAGYEIIEARDEVNNPSSHATGPHWHVVIGRRAA